MALSDLRTSWHRFAAGQAVTARAVNFATLSSFRLFAGWLAHRSAEADGTPLSMVAGRDLELTVSGLTVTVKAGVLWAAGIDDPNMPTPIAAPIEAQYDAHKAALYPLWLGSDATLTLSDGDATHPRRDLIVVTPGTSEDAYETATTVRRWLQPLTRALTRPADISPRQTWTATPSVVAGTPAASPSLPATPAGTIAIGWVEVPAGATSATTTLSMRDTRPHMWREAGHDTIPPDQYARPIVVSGGDVTESSPAAMTVEVADVVTDAPITNAGGYRRRTPGRTLEIGANSSGSTRIDTVVAVRSTSSGFTLPDQIGVVEGSQLWGPDAVVGGTRIPLAHVTVPNGATSITNAAIDDVRHARWHRESDTYRDDTFFAKIDAEAYDTDRREVTITAVDGEGAPVTGGFTGFVVEVYTYSDLSGLRSADATNTIANPTTGSSVRTGSRNRDILYPDVAGSTVVFDLLHAADVWLRVQPIVMPAVSSPTSGARSSYTLRGDDRPNVVPGGETWIGLGA